MDRGCKTAAVLLRRALLPVEGLPCLTPAETGVNLRLVIHGNLTLVDCGPERRSFPAAKSSCINAWADPYLQAKGADNVGH